MKLSEAIRMNGMMKPQGFGADSLYSLDAPCALGGALQSIGTPAKNQTDYSPVKVAWPWVKEPEFSCPIAKGCSPRTPLQMIWHLNDTHRWTRSQIADWVETVEPAEPAQEQTCELVCTETTV